MTGKTLGLIGDWKLRNTMNLGEEKKHQKNMLKSTIKIGFASGF